jgi:hypothetical protein
VRVANLTKPSRATRASVRGVRNYSSQKGLLKRALLKQQCRRWGMTMMGIKRKMRILVHHIEDIRIVTGAYVGFFVLSYATLPGITSNELSCLLLSWT